MNKLIVIPILALILFAIDYYVYQAVSTATQQLSSGLKIGIYVFYWTLTGLTMIGLLVYHFLDPFWVGKNIRMIIMVGIFILYFSKIFALLFLLIDDIRRGIIWLWKKISGTSPETVAATTTEDTIPRSAFLAKAGLAVAAVPAIGMTWGIISGAHDYRVRKRKVAIKNLPDAFEGFKIAQISDVHSGSFWNRSAVERGVGMINDAGADTIFFTGDLVNNQAKEMDDYQEIFSRLSAPNGVYSVLGNHDYGDYVAWPSAEAKRENLERLISIHKEMGWDILMNENRLIQKGNDQIAVLGIENWSAFGRFPKYGKLSEAYKGVEDVPVKLLLSHDPSHWKAEVIPQYPDIDMMFAGHTHGMQFGVNLKNFKWSPVKYFYEQWADLYNEGDQYLYVNRGFGYLGYPGRIGMPPEITLVTLEKA